MAGKDFGAEHVGIMNRKGLLTIIFEGPRYDMVCCFITDHCVQLLHECLYILNLLIDKSCTSHL